jgi:hypothetical protein
MEGFMNHQYMVVTRGTKQIGTNRTSYWDIMFAAEPPGWRCVNLMIFEGLHESNERRNITDCPKFVARFGLRIRVV